jgi:hypothetical protein
MLFLLMAVVFLNVSLSTCAHEETELLACHLLRKTPCSAVNVVALPLIIRPGITDHLPKIDT